MINLVESSKTSGNEKIMTAIDRKNKSTEEAENLPGSHVLGSDLRFGFVLKGVAPSLPISFQHIAMVAVSGTWLQSKASQGQSCCA